MQAAVPGVLLVAHGSARSGASAEPVLALARDLRRRGFEEVRCAFWKEEPFLHQALRMVAGEAVAVLPVFLAEGWFSRTVVPRELGLRPGANRLPDGRAALLLPPLGTAPELADVVVARAREAVPDATDLAGALVVVAGHGTPRDPGSAGTVLHLCRRLAGSAPFGRTLPAFLDEE
ncbi:MAG TPA: CbiX/SirB N-terminal domain-containing protein, partial [Thermoanaerobaculia bacterium]